jgi:L-arabinose isomerase
MRSLSIWEPEPNLAASAESWITAGDPQHTELSTAAEIHQLVDFGNLLTVDLLIIYGATSPSGSSEMNASLPGQS